MPSNLEDTVANRQAVNQYLRILAAHDPSFLAIVNAIQAGNYSRHTIGRHADMAASTVHKKLSQMRELWKMVDAGEIGIDSSRCIRTPHPQRRRVQAVHALPGT